MGVNKICMWMCFVYILSDFKSKADSKGNNNMTKTLTANEDKNSLTSRFRTVSNISSEQRLMTDLLRKYENSVRPIYNSSKAVGVGLGLTLTQILDLDEKNQVLTTNVWMEVEWKDEKLIWDRRDYDGTDNIRIPCRRLWLPDIVLYNSVDDYTSGYMPSLAMVYDNGRVFWGPVVRFRSSCKIDITFFPFDDQICHLKLGSWAYNGFQVNVINRSETVDLSNYVDNGEWKLIGLKVTRNSVVYNCCSEPFPDVMFFFHLRRRVKYYFMNIIIPCIILSFLCLAGFLLPPESGEKITLGLSVLLTITVFMLMVADKMPQTSESISLISIYLMVVLSMSCVSILLSVYILSLHHQRGRPLRCPQFIKIIAFSIFAPLLCLKLRSTGHVTGKYKRQENKSSTLFKKDKQEMIHLEGIKEHQNFEEELDHLLSDSSLNGGSDPVLKHYQDKQNSVNELIQWLHKKHNLECLEDMSFQEWRDVAFVIDRLLFVIFLIVTIAATAGILSLRPEQSLSGFTEIKIK
ncbi:neuronal acetylcholine receptor subunit alpha-10-like [Ruditapes philippinarum]|uniref:neuronal acetylcholine receptor subunit alpha-10-like n=1 Tax=Ruditapes philippinarum TaxID=129788 RepID=UPI00295B06A1|nr:neuronal acetylcholine receptor subunit alpha-10-like [Ruditapes philippinarum]